MLTFVVGLEREEGEMHYEKSLRFTLPLDDGKDFILNPLIANWLSLYLFSCWV